MQNFLCNNILNMPYAEDFWLVLILSVVNSVLVTIMSTRFLQMLQLSGYKIRGMFGWLAETKFVSWGRLIIVTILGGAALAITNVLLEDIFIYRTLEYLGLIFYMLFVCYYIFNIYSIRQKTPIKYTRRMNRLLAAVGIISLLVSFGLTYCTAMFVPYFAAGGLVIVPTLVPIIIAIAWLIMLPIENAISAKYLRKARDRLARLSGITVIGVTGSYGKTSVKNILATMLAQKYKVCVTPFSYNTPLGLSKTILENMEDDDQIFIAEMGARNVGDIDELCQMVKPTIGLITGISNQHMATFGSLQSIINTKSELTNFVTNQRGKMYFAAGNKHVETMYNSAKCKKTLAGLGADGKVSASNIVFSGKGTNFTLILGGKTFDNVTTSLLGDHNVSNILLAATVALDLDVSAEQIVHAIESLSPTAHRLALMPSASALIVIDDAYNGSEAGAKAAAEVLKKFDGKKVVITPGLVELGKEQFNSNFELGKMLASVCNYVIINGIVNYEALAAGLEHGQFDTKNIIRAGNLQQAVSILPSITNPGDVVLFENDLPDNYI